MAKRLPRSDEAYLVELVYWSSRAGATIEEAAQRVGISRSKAQQILRWGREKDLVQTMVMLDRMPEDDLAQRVRAAWERQGVRDVVVFPGPAHDVELRRSVGYGTFLRQQLGSLAARYLRDLSLKPRDHICIGGGRTMMAFARHFTPETTELVFRPLSIGGRWRSSVHTDAAAVLQHLHLRLGYRHGDPTKRLRAFCPEVPPALAQQLRDDPIIQALFGPKSERPVVTITALGRRRYVPVDDLRQNPSAPGPHEDTSAYVQLAAEARYFMDRRGKVGLKEVLEPLPDAIYRKTNEELYKKGVVGDLSRWAFDKLGVVQSGFAEVTSIAVEPETMRNWSQSGTTTIGVLGGGELVHVMRAALRGGFLNTLIIDTALAVQLLEPKQRPEIYRDVPPPPNQAKEGYGES